MAPAPLESSWENYIQHVKFWRSEAKRSMGEAINHIELVADLDGRPSILGLATAPAGELATCAQQMVMHAPIPLDDPLPAEEGEGEENGNGSEARQRPILELRPLIDNGRPIIGHDQQMPGTKLSPELALHYERLRGQIVTGVTAFSVHKASGSILIASSSHLTVYKEKMLSTIAQWLPENSSLLNPTFAPVNADYVAFISSSQLHIDWRNEMAFRSGGGPNGGDRPNVTNGVGSFVSQEEFERYEGYWWSPNRVELLYERVDESSVFQLHFNLPGASRTNDSSMRYPLTGTSNAQSEPRLCRLNEQTRLFEDLALDVDLKAVVPWMEYMVRMGWISTGEHVYIVAMNRLQTRMALLLVPRTMFVPTPGQGQAVGQIRIVYEENSQDWINANNLLHFLHLSPSPAGEVSSDKVDFLIGSERTDKCHLYLQSFTSTNGSECQPITAGQDWAVIKEALLKVDTERGLVFFLSNRVSPTLLTLCVSSYRIQSGANGGQSSTTAGECKVLTPSHLGYKFERSDPHLYLNPDIGFVCWLSAVDRLPECRFYRLLYSNEHLLPKAVFTHRLSVQVCSPQMTPGLNTITWGMPNLHRSPSEIFCHRFFQIPSKHSGQNHFALLLWPTTILNEGEKYPVIQSVYAGPSIQLVRNSWQTVSQYLKFVSFGYAVLLIDGRGSANRGVQFEAEIKERLGTVEVEDQVEGLQSVAEQSGLLDLDRVVAIGWSYGGYVSLLLLAEYPHVYKASCVGGAVSDWQLYDTAYTERYMGLPQLNADAYRASSLMPRVGKLPNQEGRLLIIHGMIDENVHFQHTAKLINALLSAQKPHQLLLFPNERHAVRNGEAIEHFHASVLAFFGRALTPRKK